MKLKFLELFSICRALKDLSMKIATMDFTKSSQELGKTTGKDLVVEKVAYPKANRD